VAPLAKPLAAVAKPGGLVEEYPAAPLAARLFPLPERSMALLSSVE
jgi:hypothetical protein